MTPPPLGNPALAPRGGGVTRHRARDLLAAARRTRVIVFGDLILDEFLWGTVDRISPEAPVPVVCVERESAMPGGAANVASNILALGGQPFLIGVVGEDAAGHRLRQILNDQGMETAGVLVDPHRPTTIKTRIVAHHQQVVRVDRERASPIDHGLANQCLAALSEQLAVARGVVIEDYGKGVVTPTLVRAVVSASRRARRVVAVDPKEEHFSYYRGVTTLTPNRHEAARAANIPITDRATLLRAGRRLMQRLKPESVLVTLGEDGMCLFERQGRATHPRSWSRGVQLCRATHIPTVAREVFDVSGAGDTVIAVFTLMRAAGASPVEAATMANAAAGVVVGKVGTAACSPTELMARL